MLGQTADGQFLKKEKVNVNSLITELEDNPQNGYL